MIRGLALLGEIDADMVRSYQPYWAARAHLLAKASLYDEALAAYDQAIGLSEDPAVRTFLQEKAGLVPAWPSPRRGEGD